MINLAAPVSDIDQFAHIADATTREARYVETADKGIRSDVISGIL